MYRWGHVGAALLAYAPLGAATSAGGDPALALAGVAAAVGVATLPDADEFEALPVAHRGPTHTVWFLAACALVAAALGALAGAAVGRPGALAAVLGGAVAVSVASHLLADSVTPMGIRPFAPLSSWHHSFDVTPAANPRANATLLWAGVAALVASQALVVLGVP